MSTGDDPSLSDECNQVKFFWQSLFLIFFLLLFSSCGKEQNQTKRIENKNSYFSQLNSNVDTKDSENIFELAKQVDIPVPVGCKLIETKSLAGVSHLKRIGICRCPRCRGLSKKEPVGASPN